MNKRIRELAEQSMLVTREDDKLVTGWMEYVDLTECVEKFAELIVMECASICYNSNLEDSDLHAQNLLYEFNIDDARNEK